MTSAVLLLSSSLATLRLSFYSLLNICVAVYPDTEHSEVEGSHTCTVLILRCKPMPRF